MTTKKNPHVEEVVCRICGRKFYRNTSTQKCRRLPLGVRIKTSVTCSKRCSKKNLRENQRKYQKTDRYKELWKASYERRRKLK